MSLRLNRWILDRPDGEHFAVQRSLILDIAAPQLATLPASADYYVSRQDQTKVWLTAIAAATDLKVDSIRAALGGDVVAECASDSDALLDTAAATYRLGLRLTSDLALDLLADPSYRKHQQFLVFAACHGSASPAVLEAYSLSHSQTHRGLAPDLRSLYWRNFYVPGYRPELSYFGHWLWNIVVGPQPTPGCDPTAILSAVGAL